MDQKSLLDISWATILKLGVAGLLFYFVFLIREVIIWVMFAFILSILFNPAIVFLEKLRIPRVVGTIAVYVVVFGVVAGMIFLMAPIFIAEIQQFIQLFPFYFEQVAPPLKAFGVELADDFEEFMVGTQQWLLSASSNIIAATSAIFGGVLTTFAVFFIAIFLSLERNAASRLLAFLMPKEHEEYAQDLLRRSQYKITGWFGARILSAIFVGVSTFIVLSLFEVNYALSLSVFAGLSNFIVILGPIVAGILIALLVALDSLGLAFLVLIAFTLIQQIDANILTPVLTKRFVGLPPALVLVSVLVGAQLWGVMGAILAIPMAGIIFEFLKDFLARKKERDAERREQILEAETGV